MSWDLATAKAYLGITGTDQDAIIQQVLDTTLSLIELYLGRKLLLDDEDVTMFNILGKSIRLYRYPIEALTSVDDDAVPDDWRVDKDAGLIHMPYSIFDEVNIKYSGGYDPLPLNLERVMWEIFNLAWSQTDPTTGAPIAGAGTGSGEVRSLTVFDGFKMDFDTVTSNAGSSVEETDLMWGALSPWASVLQLYRSDAGVGVAFA